jgi:hypothetical protein
MQKYLETPQPHKAIALKTYKYTQENKGRDKRKAEI